MDIDDEFGRVRTCVRAWVRARACVCVGRDSAASVRGVGLS